MVTIEVSEEEAELLASTLEWVLSDVRMEISDTDRMDFREGIKIEKRLLEKVIGQIRAAAEV